MKNDTTLKHLEHLTLITTQSVIKRKYLRHCNNTTRTAYTDGAATINHYNQTGVLSLPDSLFGDCYLAAYTTGLEAIAKGNLTASSMEELGKTVIDDDNTVFVQLLTRTADNYISKLTWRQGKAVTDSDTVTDEEGNETTILDALFSHDDYLAWYLFADEVDDFVQGSSLPNKQLAHDFILLRDEGHSKKDCAALLGCSVQTISTLSNRLKAEYEQFKLAQGKTLRKSYKGDRLQSIRFA